MLDERSMAYFDFFSDRVAVTCESCDQRSSCGGSFYIFGRCVMTKPFLNYDQLIDKLTNEKNLIVENRDYANYGMNLDKNRTVEVVIWAR